MNQPATKGATDFGNSFSEALERFQRKRIDYRTLIAIITRHCASPKVGKRFISELSRTPLVVEAMVGEPVGPIRSREFELQAYIEPFANVMCTHHFTTGSITSLLMVALNEAGKIERVERVHYTYNLSQLIFGAYEPEPTVNTIGPDLGDLVAARVNNRPTPGVPKRQPKPAEQRSTDYVQANKHLSAGAAKAPAPASSKPRHDGAMKALDRGDMVWFAPLPTSEDETAVYAGTVYAQEHKDAGFTPLKDPEQYKWSARVSPKLLATSLSRGARPVGKAAITAEELIAAAQQLQVELPTGFDQYLKPPVPKVEAAPPTPVKKAEKKVEKKPEVAKPVKPVKVPKPEHVLAAEAMKRGFAISMHFDPEGAGKGKLPVVLCEEHRVVGISPDAPGAENIKWDTYVTAEMWLEMTSIDYHPLGQMHPTERKKLAKMQKDEPAASTMDYGNALHLKPEDVSAPQGEEVISVQEALKGPHDTVMMEGCTFDGVVIAPGDSMVIQRDGQIPLVIVGVDPAIEGAEQTVVQEVPRNMAAHLPPPVNAASVGRTILEEPAQQAQENFVGGDAPRLVPEDVKS